MRNEALIFFGATQLAILFGFSPLALIGLVALSAMLIAVKAIGDRRPFDRVSAMVIVAAIATSLLTPWVIQSEEARGADFMVEAKLKGNRIEGQALKWSKQKVIIYGRDGQLHEFAHSQGSDYRKTGSKFQPYSQSEMRAELSREFGKGFDVSGTGHYLVVHPRGQKDKWAKRFDDIYRSFSHYFSTRGFQIKRPLCPLVAVVFPTQRQFHRYALKQGARISPAVLGYYDPLTNRILLYDGTRGRSSQAWHITAETIIHEAAHQAAFNTGVHSRFNMPPRWLAEGLGTMFESEGVWGSRRHFEQADRVNKERQEAFHRYLSKRRKGELAEFVSSDRLFRTKPDKAYAEAWAFSFFLSETRPREYSKYLAETARGRGDAAASSAERLQVFTEVFGADLGMLETRYVRFHKKLLESQ